MIIKKTGIIIMSANIILIDSYHSLCSYKDTCIIIVNTRSPSCYIKMPPDNNYYTNYRFMLLQAKN